MKKLVLSVGVIIGLMSCGNKINQPKFKLNELVKEEIGGYYVVNVTNYDGQDKKDTISFRIVPELVDSLKVDPKTLVEMCEETTSYAKIWNIKNKRTYRFAPEISTPNNVVFFDKKEQVIVVGCDGIAANSFGVEGDISTYVHFKTNGDIAVKDGSQYIMVCDF